MRLANVLADCGPKPEARFVWSYGADRGMFGGVAIEPYVKDLPLARVGEDVLIATEMNGAPLRPEHRFPVRLVVPGFYGTNSVKWLMRLTLAPGRADGPMTTRWYNDPVLDASGKDTGQRMPVWEIAPQSVIVSLAPDSRVQAGTEVEVWGWAWADGGVADVVVSFDDGGTWAAAEVEAPRGRVWRRFSLRWIPGPVGRGTVVSHATGRDTTRQPLFGRRNAVYRVLVDVV